MEMLGLQFATEQPAASTTTTEHTGMVKVGGAQPAAAPHNATSSAVYPGDELAIVGAVCAEVEKKSSSREQETTSGKGSRPAAAGRRERERTDSRSPGSERKRSARSRAHG